MSRNIPLCFLVLATCASTVLASAQVTPSTTESASTNAASSPVAYVYVSNGSNGANQIDGYYAAANGTLTAIPGSPFPYSEGYLAVNGAWLFGTNSNDQGTSGQFIDSFSIAANGALTMKDELNAEPGGGLISIYLDHTGSTLYADYYTTNNDYLSYSIDQSTGALTYIGDLGGGPANNSPVSFIGNNQYAYSSSCYHFTPEIIGVQRASNGTLSSLTDFSPPFPAEKSGGFYCPWLAAADPTNHIAVAMQPLKPSWASDGNYQLATYTVDTSGNLTTTSTYENMPSVEVGFPTDYRMSPSGQYLAVGGTDGLQIFNFNGANPMTKLTQRLVSKPINQLFWDNSNHLYALSSSDGELFVFTVTSTGAKRAPGTPHSIPGAANIIVLPK